MSGNAGERKLTLAEKIDQLFKTMHPAGRGEYTYEEVVGGIQRLGLETMSITQLWELRNGKKTNPRKHQLEGLAAFFEIPAAYFLDDDESARAIHAELKLLTAMRDSRVKRIAARAADLSPEALGAVTDIIERLRRIQGLPADEGHPADGTAAPPARS